MLVFRYAIRFCCRIYICIYINFFFFFLAHAGHRPHPSRGSSPSLVLQALFFFFFLRVLFRVSPLAFSRASFLPRLPLGSGCTIIKGVRLLGSGI